MTEIFFPAPKPQPRVKSPRKVMRKSRVNPINTERRKSEFERCYHSKERVAFVKSLRCLGCGIDDGIQNAHVGRDSGMGRKGDYTEIVPLCGNFGLSEGCHAESHRVGLATFAASRGINLKDEAAKTESAWKLFQQEKVS